MYIPLSEIAEKYSLKIKGIIQVGCHWCQEHDEFVKMAIDTIVYIEPCKKAFHIVYEKFKDNKNIHLFNVACGAMEGEFDMYVSNNNQGQSNSLLKPLLHLQQHPEVRFTEVEKVDVALLDNLDFEKKDYNVLMMDVQGFEGEVFKGAKETLKHIDCIYTECNRGQTYEGNMEIEEMDKLLEGEFTRTDTYWPSPNLTWGDCCFIRTSLLKK